MEDKKKIKDSNKKRWLKNIGLLIGYLLVFIIIPFYTVKGLMIFIYFIFIAPFLMFIPLSLAKFNHNFESIIFLLIGWLITAIYIFNVISLNSTHNSGWLL